ncbi:hypothetical protein TNCT_108721 [Trichonephila clavata]|uniref:Uncharacterized protein n=1 Tax=Trichonephila clavata TaxID=2740835 RepID=A0A8X6M535_TRICU|nr:hypothetical protein TNCT_108721 [Trichonephila clavata]
MRIIGKEHSAAKTLCSAISVDVPFKKAFDPLKKKLEFAASNVACNTMKEASLEIRGNKNDAEFSQCGVSLEVEGRHSRCEPLRTPNFLTTQAEAKQLLCNCPFGRINFRINARGGGCEKAGHKR